MDGGGHVAWGQVPERRETKNPSKKGGIVREGGLEPPRHEWH